MTQGLVGGMAIAVQVAAEAGQEGLCMLMPPSGLVVVEDYGFIQGFRRAVVPHIGIRLRRNGRSFSTWFVVSSAWSCDCSTSSLRKA